MYLSGGKNETSFLCSDGKSGMTDEKTITNEKPSREQVWLSVWCSVANSTNCVHPDTPGNWADNCLKEFEQRFKKGS